MKIKNIAIIILAFIASSFISLNAEHYTWSSYDLSFDVPEGGFVSYNSSSRFEIMWEDMSLIIQLYDKEGTNDKLIKQNLNKTAAGYNVYDGNITKFSANNFKGFSLVGQLPDGSMANFSNLISSKSKLFLHIEINYLRGNEKVVRSILKSFEEGKKQKIKKEKPLKQKIQKKDAAPKPIKDTTPPGQLFDV